MAFQQSPGMSTKNRKKKKQKIVHHIFGELALEKDEGGTKGTPQD